MKKKLNKFVCRLQENVWYASLFILLASLSLGLLAYEHLANVDEYTRQLIFELDIIIAYFFLIDFFMGVFFNKKYQDKKHKHHFWLDLLASIPVGFELVRAFRILRIFRALRIFSSSLELYFAKKRLNRIKH